MRKLFDTALFWIAMGSGLAVVGTVAVDHVHIPKHTSEWHVAWFDVGVGVIVTGAAMLVWALVLFMAHRHFDRHVSELRAQTPVQIHSPSQSGVTIYTRTATAPASPQASAPTREGWVSPEELGNYLDTINQTMEAHGFGRNPNLLSQPPNEREDRRAALIVAGLTERTNLGNVALLQIAGIVGFPRVTNWLRDAQAYLHEVGSPQADASLVHGYSDRRQAQDAIDQTLRALARPEDSDV